LHPTAGVLAALRNSQEHGEEMPASWATKQKRGEANWATAERSDKHI
jgi:hypothetical protein